MKKIYLLMAMMILMLAAACGKKEQRPPRKDRMNAVQEAVMFRARTEMPDLSDTAKTTTAVPERTSGGSASSTNNSRQDYDNMRGFDPASEDDMDDNGMSRYMENDDEEGWE